MTAAKVSLLLKAEAVVTKLERARQDRQDARDAIEHLATNVSRACPSCGAPLRGAVLERVRTALQRDLATLDVDIRYLEGRLLQLADENEPIEVAPKLAIVR